MKKGKYKGPDFSCQQAVVILIPTEYQGSTASFFADFIFQFIFTDCCSPFSWISEQATG